MLLDHPAQPQTALTAPLATVLFNLVHPLIVLPSFHFPLRLELPPKTTAPGTELNPIDLQVEGKTQNVGQMKLEKKNFGSQILQEISLNRKGIQSSREILTRIC
jgi:hypothetical protein